MRPVHVILVGVLIALLWFGFFWNPIIAVLGFLMVLLVSAVTGVIKK